MLGHKNLKTVQQSYGKAHIRTDDKLEPSGSQLVTPDDLEAFRVKLKMAIKIMLEGNIGKPAKRWLKSVELRKLLNISPGTLQTLRNNGKLPFTKIGGLIYYDAFEIDQLLVSQRRDFLPHGSEKANN